MAIPRTWRFVGEDGVNSAQPNGSSSRIPSSHAALTLFNQGLRDGLPRPSSRVCGGLKISYNCRD